MWPDSVLFGAFLGLCLATKYTTASLGAVVIGGMAFAAARQFGWKQLAVDYWKSPYFLYPLSMCAAAASVYCLIIAPAFLSDEIASSFANQWRMALSRGDLQGASRIPLLAEYLIQTLPAGMGWPTYLLGWVGLITKTKRLRSATIAERLLML